MAYVECCQSHKRDFETSLLRARTWPLRPIGRKVVLRDAMLFRVYVLVSRERMCTMCSLYHSNQQLLLLRRQGGKTNPSFHTETAIMSSLFTAKPVNMAPLGNHSHRFTSTSPSNAHTVNPLHMLFEMVTTSVRSKQGKKRTSEIDVISLHRPPTTRGAGGLNAD